MPITEIDFNRKKSFPSISKSKSEIVLFGKIKFHRQQAKSSIQMPTVKHSFLHEKNINEINHSLNQESKNEELFNYLNQNSREFKLPYENVLKSFETKKVKKSESAKHLKIFPSITAPKPNSVPLTTHNETASEHSNDENKNEKYKNFITIDTSKARSNSEVLRVCINELKWTECPNGLPNQGCDIIWQSCTTNESDQSNIAITPYQSRINKFPCN